MDTLAALCRWLEFEFRSGLTQIRIGSDPEHARTKPTGVMSPEQSAHAVNPDGAGEARQGEGGNASRTPGKDARLTAVCLIKLPQNVVQCQVLALISMSCDDLAVVDGAAGP